MGIKLIGIVGRKRSGKDTLYSYLSQLSHQPAKRFAFGDALKKEVSVATGVPIHIIEQLKDVFRPVLQWWGTDFRRKYCHEDYWLKPFKETLYSVNSNTLLVVTDVRFHNEAAVIRENGGFLVRIERKGPWWKRMFYRLFSDRHQSEAESDQIPVELVINNNGSPDALADQAQALLDIIRMR